MKDVYELIDRAINECLAVKIEPGAISKITIGHAQRRWGQTKKLYDGTYQIEISEQLLHDEVSDKATMNTVVHEVLHTCYNCMNHGPEWKMRAKLMNITYGYNIKRVTAVEEKGFDRNEIYDYKYEIVCHGCGKSIYKSMRKTNVINRIQRYGVNSGCACKICRSRNLEVVTL